MNTEPEYLELVFEADGLETTLRADLTKATHLPEKYKRKYLYTIRSKIQGGKKYYQSYDTAEWLNIGYRNIFKETIVDKEHSGMPHLSFHEKKDGTAIAQISSGEHKGEILFCYEGEGVGDKPGLKKVTLPKDSKFQVVPNPDPDKREVYYICGASGCGKSYFVKGLIQMYRKLFPDRDVYLATQLEADETLDSLRPPIKRIRISSFLEKPPKIDEFENCFFICDDFDTLPKAELNALWNVIDMIAIQGRHTKTSLAVISHYITNFKMTRLILNEATRVVVYPQATSIGNLRYMLERKFGIDVDMIKSFKRMKTRWVCLQAMYPQYYITETSASLLNQEED